MAYRLEQWLPTKRPQTRFLLAFPLAYALLAFLSTRDALQVQAILRDAFTTLVVGFASSVGWGAVVLADNVVVFSGGAFRYQVVDACTGLEIALLFVAGVLAYPGAPWAKRAWGLVGGLVFIFGVNLVRLLSLAWLGMGGWEAAFESAHAYWWSAIMFVIVAGAWWTWTQWAVPSPGLPADREAPAASPGFSRRIVAGLRAVVLPGVIFAGVLVAFWAVGFRWGVAEWYVATLTSASAWVAHQLLDISITPRTDRFPELGWWYYALPAGVVALFLATPRKRWHHRAGMALVAVAVTLLAGMVAFVVGWHARAHWSASGLLLGWGQFFLRVGPPMALWALWARSRSRAHLTGDGKRLRDAPERNEKRLED